MSASIDRLEASVTRLGLLCLAAGFFSLGAVGCSSSSTSASDGYLEFAIDKSNAGELLSYFFGSYVGSGGGNPFDAGILVEQDGRYFVRPDALAASFPPAAGETLDSDSSGVVDWDELKSFLQATYYEARGVPPTLDSLRRETHYRDTATWFTVAVDGVMTTARRHIYVSRDALASALEGYVSSDEQLLYPVETTIVGEHRRGNEIVEVTAMRKRGDGYWDYFVYDSTGHLATSTDTDPKRLAVPAQCAGCHFGSRLYEPEESFPGRAPPGPHGPRRIHVGEPLRRPDVVRHLDEHRKRSDDVLGIYNTLFVAKLLQMRKEGTLTSAQKQLLDAVNL